MAANSTVYEHTDYKTAIKETLREMRKTKSALTLKTVATRVSIQPTYFSRVLNDERSHLSEDQLFEIGRVMKLLPDEVDYLMLLRSHSTSQDSKRKEALFKRIEGVRKVHLASAEQKEWNPQEFHNEAEFLFSPLCTVVRVALFIKEYQKNPRALCSPLGISVGKLKEILKTLHASEYIVLSEDDPFQIIEVKNRYPHFGREHPLTRAHQLISKTALLSRLQETSEEEKESLLFTFTMDDAGFAKVRDEFKSFVNKVQKIATDSKHKSLYQLSFDFAKWL